jgi:2-dehydro-3-deoxy-D-arabinonate dehydratase
VKLRLTADGPALHRDGRHLLLDTAWDDIFTADDPIAMLRSASGSDIDPGEALAPIGRQEVWAAGVTYFRSRDARMEESAGSGAADLYERVYDAERPELFLKATPHRVRGPGQSVRIRADSKWNVPEPELTLAISSAGRIFVYTIGNDMSSRDIEGDNALYLPQAKTYDGSAALGPELLISDEGLAATTDISMRIERDRRVVFAGATSVSQIKRSLTELVGFLTRECTFPAGCYLMTGTGIVPDADFTLHRGDVVHITIDPIGTLSNTVA